MKKNNINDLNIRRKIAAFCTSFTIAATTLTGCTIKFELPDNILDNFKITKNEDNSYTVEYVDDQQNKTTTSTLLTNVNSTTTTVNNQTITSTTKDNTTTIPASISTQNINKTTDTTTTTMTTTKPTTTTTTTTMTTTKPTTTTTTTTTTTKPVTTKKNNQSVVGVESLRENTYTFSNVSEKWAEDDFYYYRVQENDTIYALTYKFNISEKELRELNNLENNDTIITDVTILKVPAKLVKMHVDETTRLSSIALNIGLDLNYLIEINRANHIYRETEYVPAGTDLLVNAIFDGSNTFDTKYGKETIFTNDVIIRDIDKYEIKANNNGTYDVLAFNELTNSNQVSWIEITDGSREYIQTIIALNAKDIGMVNNIPIVYTYSNIKEDVNIRTASHDTYQTSIFYGYNCTFNEDAELIGVITYNNEHHDELGLKTHNKQYTR